ncbi:MAG: NADPH-dependent FMN reductase [Bacteroidia bacterium]
MPSKPKLLAICGSLRAGSSAAIVMQAITARLSNHFEITTDELLRTLPLFDDAAEHPQSVINFRAQITAADIVLFCTPEYAFGIPGALKNALDWTVGTGELNEKPVALVVAASTGKHTFEAMQHVLNALGTLLSDDRKLLISFVRNKVNANGEVKDADTVSALDMLVHNIQLFNNKSF